MNAHLLTILLAVFAQMETPRGIPTHPGAAGETGRWALTPAVRHDRGIEILIAGTKLNDENIARAQILWIAKRLEAHHRPVNAFNVALAWNAGVTAEIQGTAPNRAYDYAARASALAEDAERKP